MKDPQSAVNEILTKAALMLSSPKLIGKKGPLQLRMAAELIYDKKTQTYKKRNQ